MHYFLAILVLAGATLITITVLTVYRAWFALSWEHAFAPYGLVPIWFAYLLAVIFYLILT